MYGPQYGPVPGHGVIRGSLKGEQALALGTEVGRRRKPLLRSLRDVACSRAVIEKFDRTMELLGPTSKLTALRLTQQCLAPQVDFLSRTRVL